jgi:hypothetical protein
MDVNNHLDDFYCLEKQTQIKLLEFILSQIMDQQKYAESKNGALLGLNSAIVLGYLAMIPYTIYDCPKVVFWYSVSFVLCNCLSIISSLFSFIPILDNSVNQKIKNPDYSNVFFFMDLSKLQVNEFLSNILKVILTSNPYSEESLLSQLSNQIIVNSTICKKKHKRFIFSVWFTIFGLLTPIVGLTIFFFWFKKNRSSL